MAQVSALYLVPGVTSLSYRENETNLAATIDGIYLLPNSVWACISGGANADIGSALLAGKTGGAAWNGSQSANVIEPASGQTYQILFDRPELVALIARVTLSQGASNSNLLVTAPQAVVDFANGLISGEPGFIVGANASPFDLAAAIAEENPGVKVRKVELSIASVGIYQTTEIAIALNQQATITLGAVQVLIV